MEFLLPLEIHNDERGSLFEIIRDDEIKEQIKQVYFSISKPNAIRGNHFHKRKIEWFSVVKGKGMITLKNSITNKTEKYTLSGDEPSIVKVEPEISHVIKNIGEGDMYLIVVANEVFDPLDQDTFFEEIIE